MLKLFVILVCLSVAFAASNVTTPPPTPSPTPPHGNFSLMNNKTKKYCLLAEFAATFTINYLAKVHEEKNKTKTMNKTATIFVNRTNEDDVDIRGDCGRDKKPANLTLTWPKKEGYYTLTMEFGRIAKALEASDNTSWAVQKISLLATLKGNEDFPNATEDSISSSYNGSAGPSGKVGGYYSCRSKSGLTLNTGLKDYSVDADLQDLKVEPFVSKNTSDDFGKDAKHCAQDKTTTPAPTTTPITNGTTPKPTNGSTTAKSTSSTTTPAPTPSPTLPPPPPHGNFSLMNSKTKKYCLLAEFAATFTIKYLARAYKDNTTNTTKKEETGIIYLNRTNEDDVDIGGDCGSGKKPATLSLTWPKKGGYYTLTMEFGKVAKAYEASDNSSTWAVKMISLRVNLNGTKDFPNATEPNITYTGSAGPSGNVGGYYSCRSKSKLKLSTGVKNYSVAADLQDLKLEPFVSKNTSDAFGKDANECYQDNPTTTPTPTPTKSNNNIVPIAVGCALAGLVLIVLIAYIIGRRKSHRGYEKV